MYFVPFTRGESANAEALEAWKEAPEDVILAGKDEIASRILVCEMCCVLYTKIQTFACSVV